MRGFVTIDCQPGSGLMALWTTSCIESVPAHVNAVVIDQQEDPDVLWKVRTLTRDAAVVMTDGSDPSGLPLDETPHGIEAIAALADHALALQRRILDAVEAFAKRPSAKTGAPPNSPRKIVYPDFEPVPEMGQFAPTSTTTQHRALAAANYVRALWSYWIATDEQRRRRTRSPKGVSPWMMPADLGGPGLELLPVGFLAELRIESAAVGQLRRAGESLRVFAGADERPAR